MADRNSPIGIFDSGIGGLTVANAIHRNLPEESIVYFGDTAHLPYGDKSKELISQYAIGITQFLLEEADCKAIVIACNTASAAAYATLRDTYQGQIPIINVIDPMIEAVIADTSIHHAGIIATKTTIQSRVYQEKFTRRKPELKYSALATPLLAPMIEEGYFKDNIQQAIIEEYLSNPILDGIDGLILACTHYPLIKKEIHAYYAGKVKIFDSAEVVARKLKFILEKEQLSNTGRKDPNVFYVSDFTTSFEDTTRMFYGEKIHLEKIDLWK